MRDVTFGQYYPAASPIHRLDSRIKLLATILFVVMVFFITTYASYLVTVLFLLFIIVVSKIPLIKVLKSIKAVLFIVIFVFILNVFLNKDGNVLAHWWVFTVTDTGLDFSVKMALRLVILVMGTSMLSFTTSPTELTDGIESLLRPLKLIKVPVADIAIIMSMALRFIPTLVEETDKIISAQKARGSGFDTGGLISKVRAMLPILIPLFVSAFRRADDLADALDARCYNASPRRTKLRRMKIGIGDVIAFFAVGAVFAFIMLDKYFWGGVDVIILDFFKSL